MSSRLSCRGVSCIVLAAVLCGAIPAGRGLVQHAALGQESSDSEEDRPTGGENGWQFALARFNFREMWVTRNDQEIWRVGVSAQEDNYITGVVGEVSLAEIRESVDQKRSP